MFGHEDDRYVTFSLILHQKHRLKFENDFFFLKFLPSLLVCQPFLEWKRYWLRVLGEEFFLRSSIHSSSVYKNPQIHIEPLSVFPFSVTTDDLQSNLCEIRYRNVFHSRRAAATIVISWKRKMFLCTSEISSCLENVVVAGVGKWGQIVCFFSSPSFHCLSFLLFNKTPKIIPHWKTPEKKQK